MSGMTHLQVSVVGQVKRLQGRQARQQPRQPLEVVASQDEPPQVPQPVSDTLH